MHFGKYHSECFRCAGCRTSLLSSIDAKSGGGGVLVKDGCVYCLGCHTERFAERCGKCANVFQPKQRVVVFEGLRMHPECFVCAGPCGHSLGMSGCQHIVERGKPYCTSCHTAAFGLKCAKCGLPLADGTGASTPYVTLKGSKLHPSCFCCSECGVVLSAAGHYEKHGQPYCADHFRLRFGQACMLCGERLLTWHTGPGEETGRSIFMCMHTYIGRGSRWGDLLLQSH